MSCSSVNNLIDAREGEGILRAGLVEVFEIDAQAPGFILLLAPSPGLLASPGVLFL